jgi:peptide-methionine (S)-S-oxide reductase
MKCSHSFLILALLFFVGCNANNKKPEASTLQVETQDLSKYKKAYFASGCFWCVEAIFESVKGVKEAVSGYAGGNEESPTYYQVSRGQTSHAEAVVVYYDPKEVDFKTLVTVFFGSHDPTTKNRQGPDKGAQYRSIAFYQNNTEKAIIEGFIDILEEQKIFDEPIVTEVKKLTKFWKAEEEHQDFEKLNPNNSYVKNVSIPRLKSFQKRFPHLIKKEH